MISGGLGPEAKRSSAKRKNAASRSRIERSRRFVDLDDNPAFVVAGRPNRSNRRKPGRGSTGRGRTVVGSSKESERSQQHFPGRSSDSVAAERRANRSSMSRNGNGATRPALGRDREAPSQRLPSARVRSSEWNGVSLSEARPGIYGKDSKTKDSRGRPMYGVQSAHARPRASARSGRS